MDLLDYFFSGLGVGCFIGTSVFLIRFGVVFVRRSFDSPAWEDL